MSQKILKLDAGDEKNATKQEQSSAKDYSDTLGGQLSGLRTVLNRDNDLFR